MNEVINNYYINIENDKIVVTTSFDTTFELEELLEYYGIVKNVQVFRWFVMALTLILIILI